MNKKYPKACGGVAGTPDDEESLQRMLLPVYAPIAWGRGTCCDNLATDDIERGCCRIGKGTASFPRQFLAFHLSGNFTGTTQHIREETEKHLRFAVNHFPVNRILLF